MNSFVKILFIMLKIRLQRVGRKHEPAFRVVLTDSRNSTKSGRFLEVLGSYDPRGKRGAQGLNKERISYLISKGAQTTASMHNLLIKNGVIKGAKIDVSSKKKGGATEVLITPQESLVKEKKEVEKEVKEDKKTE
ncbi:MAG: 30S ribosomal protein S16 [bacterium]|nr:30S ribosomal protein S16 [bacterium]